MSGSLKAGAGLAVGLLAAGAVWGFYVRKLRAQAADKGKDSTEVPEPKIGRDQIMRILGITGQRMQVSMQQVVQQAQRMSMAGMPQQQIEQQLMQGLAQTLAQNDAQLFEKEGVSVAEVKEAVAYWSAKDPKVKAVATNVKQGLGQFFKLPDTVPDGMDAKKFITMFESLMTQQISLMEKVAEVLSEKCNGDHEKFRKSMAAVMGKVSEQLKTEVFVDLGITEEQFNVAANTFNKDPQVMQRLQIILQKQAKVAQRYGLQLR